MVALLTVKVNLTFMTRIFCVAKIRTDGLNVVCIINFFWAKQQKKLETEGKYTIWTMKRDRVNEYQHPTQKPVELITYALMNSSKAEDLVVDPFLGSGSTLIACEKTGRVCAGIELDPKFVDVIVQRWVDYTGNEQVVRNGQPEIWPKTIYEHESKE